MTIAIHESALIRHFNTRKEVLRAWEEKIGARFSPFRGFKMPDSRLYIEDSDFTKAMDLLEDIEPKLEDAETIINEFTKSESEVVG